MSRIPHYIFFHSLASFTVNYKRHLILFSVVCLLENTVAVVKAEKWRMEDNIGDLATKAAENCAESSFELATMPKSTAQAVHWTVVCPPIRGLNFGYLKLKLDAYAKPDQALIIKGQFHLAYGVSLRIQLGTRGGAQFNYDINSLPDGITEIEVSMARFIKSDGACGIEQEDGNLREITLFIDGEKSNVETKSEVWLESYELISEKGSKSLVYPSKR